MLIYLYLVDLEYHKDTKYSHDYQLIPHFSYPELRFILFSCSKEGESIVTNNDQVEINAGTKAGIQNFINQVNEVNTRTTPTNPNDLPQYKMRIYITGDSNCRDGNGYCLPEVIITPSIQKPWISTPEGSTLQEMVYKNQITMSKEFSSASNTEFYIYKGVKDKNLEIVVPVAYK